MARSEWGRLKDSPEGAAILAHVSALVAAADWPALEAYLRRLRFLYAH